MSAPKLRFKEFDKAFSRNTIKELAKIYVGRDLVEDAYSPVKTETHIYPIYSNSVDNEGLYGYYNFEEFNFDDGALTVVGRGAGLGKAFYRQGGVGTIGRLLSLTPKDKSFHPKYLSDYINDKLIIHNESGGIPQLPRSSLENYEVVLPSYEEQTKIASFLSAVDEKISQLSQKHELLSQYKQGMMQKLFSQQIRFKADDGREFGEWEEVKLGDLVDLISGFAFKSDYFAEDGHKLITPKNFTTTGKASFTAINTKWTTEEADEKYICRPDDLLVLLTDLTQSCELLGKPVLLNHDNGNVLLNQRIVKIITGQKLQKTFLLYLLLTDSYHELIVSTASGTTVKHSSNKVLQSYSFDLPCLEEQTKIANFLSAIDQKIEVVAQQIEQAKTWKKGLLQQMFV